VLTGSRRSFLQAGALGALGLTLPDLLRAEAGPRPSSGRRGPRAKACILVHLFGGPAQLDTWDMKPDAPEDIRGEFRPVRTRVPGLLVCELMPRLARAAHLLTVVRSMTHERTVHGGAIGFVLTGTRTADAGIPGVRGPDASVGDHPNLGAAVSRFRPSHLPVPSAVTLPYTMIDGQGRFVPGQTAGMLGDRHNPWFVNADPSAEHFRVEGLQLPADLPASRLAGRQTLLSRIERQQQSLEDRARVRQLDAYQQKAFRLLTSNRTREAFRIDREPAALRDRFGRNSFGQSCLLACRLVAAGVRFVQVNMGNRLATGYGWDTHAKNFPRLRNPLLPVFDPGLASLLETLRERGLLADTLVVCMSEFGRTPRVQRNNGGRDHWPRCYSLVLAGAGIPGGVVHGRSDRIAAYPTADPTSPEDVAATIYAALGIDPDTEIRDAQNRPLKLVQGKPLLKLWG
jgi:uncharacterized protein (DUF1501 family)